VEPEEVGGNWLVLAAVVAEAVASIAA